MIDAIALFLIFVILVIINGTLYDIRKSIDRLPPILPEKPKDIAFVTRTDPAFANENMVGQGDSVIVTPKSPQLVEWEEQEELRKLNLRQS